MSGPADPNAPTRTAAPAGSDVEPTRSADGADETQDASAVSAVPRYFGGAPTVPGHVSPQRPRLPAPLQYRDPERYELQAEHGRGGLGRVLRARDRELGRAIAIKELLRPTATAELRFFREALITARLEHPSIVPVHEAGRWPDGTPFYAMKLVAGRPLREAIDDAGSLEKRLALLPHVIAVADAIAYAHSRRIIHRDLKPSNVMVGDFGETVVIDWGLAKDLDASDSAGDEPSTPPERGSSLTVAGTVLGTPGYMPPEQERGVADERSDVYALGGILFHVLFNQAPNGPAPRGDSLTARVPAALLAVIRRAMAADPADRYASARDFAQDLRDFQGGRLVGAHRYTFAELVGHWASHNKRLIALGVVAAVLLAVVVAVSARRVLAERTTAELERDRARSTADELVLSHARRAVSTNPTQSLLWLRRYTGRDTIAAQDIAAEAIARGVSRYVLNAHDAPVMHIVAVDDSTLLSSAAGSSLEEWSLRGDRVTSRTLVETLDASGAFAYHPQRRRLAFVAPGGELVVRDAGSADRVVARTQGYVHELHFSEAGDRVLAISATGESLLAGADAASTPVVVPAGGGMRAAGFLDAGQRILAAGADGTVRVLDGHTARELSSQTLSPILEGAFGADRSALVHADGTVSFLTAEGRVESTVPMPSGCFRPTLSHRAALLALTCGERTVVLSAPAGKQLYELPHANTDAYAVFSSDDAWLAVATRTGAIQLVSTGQWTRTTLLGHGGVLFAPPVFIRDALVSGDENGELRVWPLPASLTSVAVPGDLRTLALSPDGRSVASGSDVGVVRLWTAGGLVREYRGHSGVISWVRFSEDGRQILTSGLDGTARVWPVTGEGAVVLDAGVDLLSVIPFGPGRVVTVGKDGKLLRWDLATRSPSVLYRDAGSLFMLEPRGDHIVFGGAAGVVHDYDGATGQVVELARHPGPLRGLRHAADWVVSGSKDAVVLSPRTPGQSQQRIALPAALANLQVSADGLVLAVATDDRRVRLYALDGAAPHLIATHEANVRRMRFSPTGQTLAAVCYDDMIRVWDLAAGTSAAFHLGEGTVPMGVEFLEGGTTLAIGSPFRFVVAPLAAPTTVSPGATDLRTQVDRLVLAYQTPRRATLDELVLFGPADPIPDSRQPKDTAR